MKPAGATVPETPIWGFWNELKTEARWSNCSTCLNVGAPKTRPNPTLAGLRRWPVSGFESRVAQLEQRPSPHIEDRGLCLWLRAHVLENALSPPS
jgi:hypothetical protein